MSMVKDIKRELDAKREEAKQAWAAFAELREKGLADGVDFGKDETKFNEAHEAHKTYGELADAVAGLESRLAAAIDMETRDGAPAPGETEQRAAKAGIWTPGLRVVQNETYKKLAEGGELLKQKGVDLPRIEVANLEEAKAMIRGLAGAKALITGADDTGGGAFVTPDRQGYYPGLLRPLMIRNLVTVGQTDSDLVEWVQETSFTNAAAEVAEATDLLGTGAKPESALAFAVIQSAVKTIATWVPATKRALSDAGQLRTIIDQRLEDGVNLRLDSQMINGNGAGENLRGILNTVGIGAVTTAVGEPPIEAVLRGITTVRLAFMEPTSVGFHPNDWVTIRVMKDANDNYIMGPPNMPGPEQVWGVPVHQSAVYPASTALVGKFDEAILWVREGISVSATDSHADFFTHNLVAILAEGRFAFGVPRPAAFCSVDLTP